MNYFKRLIIISALFSISVLSLFAEDRYQKFFDAAMSGKLDELKAMVEQDKKIKVSAIRDSDGSTLLHIAALNGEVQITEYLLSKGADASAVDANGWTPMHMAAVYCYYPECVDIAKLLIAKGASKKAVTKKAVDQFPAGLTAADVALIAKGVFGKSLGPKGYDSMIEFLKGK